MDGTLDQIGDFGFLEESMMRIRSFAVFVSVMMMMAVAAVACAQPAAGNLKNPAALKETAPAVYNAKFETSAGTFVIEVHRDWAPLGADRFYNLVKNGFYDDCRFFRVLSNFMAQFGINGDPTVMSAWRGATIGIDPVKQSNKRGYITYAMGAGRPDSRTTQVFINFIDNVGLDSQGFAPFGKVTTGMDVVDKLYAAYGEGAPGGRGPDQGQIQTEGNAFLKKDFPKLDYITKAVVLP
jgi:peptidyl-prolyl cis-trans isomerase A (cyclophilin A)